MGGGEHIPKFIFSSPHPQFTLKKYFDVTAPIAQVQPTAISKINTLVQLVLVGAALLAPVAEMQQHPAFYGLW